jgi:hypothetical protein
LSDLIGRRASLPGRSTPRARDRPPLLRTRADSSGEDPRSLLPA